jgi:ferric-dicitrate binding protein FerR (iron transport regulator)
MYYFRYRESAGRARDPYAAVLVLTFCLIGLAPAQAADGHWTMAAVDGVAMVATQGGEGYEASQGHPLVAGATLVTGDESTVTLVRRGDSMTVYPNSEVTIPKASDGDRLGVVQGLGKLLFRMETRESRNFEVRTPYLAATVKGTVFTVEVATDNATVTVAEGSVLVAPARGGRSQMVHAGNRASVKAGSANQVDVETVAAGQSSIWKKGRARGKQAGGRSRGANSSAGNGQGNDSQGNDSQGNDSQGNDSQGDDSQGDDSQ